MKNITIGHKSAFINVEYIMDLPHELTITAQLQAVFSYDSEGKKCIDVDLMDYTDIFYRGVLYKDWGYKERGEFFNEQEKYGFFVMTIISGLIKKLAETPEFITLITNEAINLKSNV